MPHQILIVDDEEYIGYVVQVCLEQTLGWQAITAKSGREGLQIAQSQTLDAILLDVSMPQMDGIQVFKKLQSIPESQNIPVIFLTANVLLSDRQSLEALNPAGIIYKPFNPLTLGQEIAAILGWSDESQRLSSTFEKQKPDRNQSSHQSNFRENQPNHSDLQR